MNYQFIIQCLKKIVFKYMQDANRNKINCAILSVVFLKYLTVEKIVIFFFFF